MALALRSVFHSNDKSIRLYIGSQYHSDGRYSRGGPDTQSNVFMVKMQSKKSRSRCLKFPRAPRICSSLGSKCSNFLLKGVEISTHSICRRMPEVTSSSLSM